MRIITLLLALTTSAMGEHPSITADDAAATVLCIDDYSTRRPWHNSQGTTVTTTITNHESLMEVSEGGHHTQYRQPGETLAAWSNEVKGATITPHSSLSEIDLIPSVHKHPPHYCAWGHRGCCNEMHTVPLEIEEPPISLTAGPGIVIEMKDGVYVIRAEEYHKHKINVDFLSSWIIVALMFMATALTLFVFYGLSKTGPSIIIDWYESWVEVCAYFRKQVRK